MTAIKKKTGGVDTFDIIREVRIFYKELFTATETVENDQDMLLSRVNKKISKENFDKCEKVLLEKELLTALKQMDVEKSPGSDG